jgi:hypothetical protein
MERTTLRARVGKTMLRPGLPVREGDRRKHTRSLPQHPSIKGRELGVFLLLQQRMCESSLGTYQYSRLAHTSAGSHYLRSFEQHVGQMVCYTSLTSACMYSSNPLVTFDRECQLVGHYAACGEV